MTAELVCELHLLEKADDTTGGQIHIHVVETWASRQAGDCHDITADRVDVSSTYSCTHIAYSDLESCGDTLGGRVGAQRVLGLCHTFMTEQQVLVHNTVIIVTNR